MMTTHSIKKALLGTLLAFPCVLGLQAQEQSAADAMKEINKIKLDGNYLSASATSTQSYDEAIENAQTILNLEVQQWIKEQNLTNVDGVIIPTKDKCMSIQTKRGNLFRAFVYVKKGLISPLEKEKPQAKEEEANLVTQATEATLAGLASEPAKETKADSKAKEKATTKQGKKKQSKEDAKSAVPDLQAAIEEVYVPDAFEQEMLAVKKSEGIEKFLNSKSITNSGQYKNRPKNGMYYLMIYNREGEVPACLKFNDGKLTNVQTGKDDTFDNYKGCGAVWFIKKQ